jgi:hypothetical protein
VGPARLPAARGPAVCMCAPVLVRDPGGRPADPGGGAGRARVARGRSGPAVLGHAANAAESMVMLIFLPCSSSALKVTYLPSCRESGPFPPYLFLNSLRMRWRRSLERS